MSDDITTDEGTAGLDRRSLIKRSAVVGGALVWTTPVVQSIARPAFADTSPVTQGCPPNARYYVKFNEGSNTPDCGVGASDCGFGGQYQCAPSNVANGITITYNADKTVATITLPAGYELDTSQSRIKSSDSCEGTFVRNPDGTYTATSGSFNQNGNRQAISNLQLILVCVPA